MRWRIMARYYFHLHECGAVTPDLEGREFATLAAAHAAAIVDARAIMCDEIGDGGLCLSCHIELTDAGGQSIERVLFRDAVTLTG